MDKIEKVMVGLLILVGFFLAARFSDRSAQESKIIARELWS